MWLMTQIGFFSIVCKPDDIGNGTLTIRARVKSDLEALRQNYLPNLGEIATSADTDYRYRARARRDEISQALSKLVHQVEYDNFKNEVAKKQGKTRAKTYGEVWSVMYELQETQSN